MLMWMIRRRSCESTTNTNNTRPVNHAGGFVFLSLCYVVLQRVLQLASLRFRSNDFKKLEIVVLRHEPAILRRRIRRQAMTSTDRLFLAANQPAGSAIESGENTAPAEQQFNNYCVAPPVRFDSQSSPAKSEGLANPGPGEDAHGSTATVPAR
jgi:hypothetical protein